MSDHFQVDAVRRQGENYADWGWEGKQGYGQLTKTHTKTNVMSGTATGRMRNSISTKLAARYSCQHGN